MSARKDTPSVAHKYHLDCIIPIHDVKNRGNNVRKILKGAPDSVRVIVVHDRGLVGRNSTSCEECASLIKGAERHLVLCGSFLNPGKARNIAIEKLEARWTCFVDSDDEVNLLQILNYSVIADGLNKEIFVAEASVVQPGVATKKLKAKTIFPLSNFSLNPGLWRCVFITELIKKLRFPELNWAEDQVFLASALRKSLSTPLFLEHEVYRYHVGEGPQLIKNEAFWPDLFRARTIIADLVSSSWNSKSNLAIVQLMILRIDLSCLKREKSYSNIKAVFSRSSFLLNIRFTIELVAFLIRIRRS